MMTYVEAPHGWPPGGPSLFLAGGITGCPDWQAEVVSRLGDLPLTLLNPRRKDFPIHDPDAAEEQITWEFRNLDRASAIMFWFAEEQTQPIALFELGKYVGSTSKPIFIGWTS